MEGIIRAERGFTNMLLPLLVVVTLAFAMVVIAFSMESIAPGIHNLFHDFRHVTGMPCH